MRYLLKYKAWMLTALFGIIGTNVLSVIVPYILRDVVDIGIENRDSSYMLSAGMLVVGLGILRGGTTFLSRFFGERLSHYISYDIRNQIYDKVQGQSFTYHDNAQIGTIITRAISDVNEIQRYFAFGLLDGLNVLFLLIGTVSVMLATSPILAVIAFIPLVPLALFSNHFVMRIHPRWKQVMNRMQVLSNHIQENALGAEVVRVFAREAYEIGRFSTENKKLFEEQLDFIKQWITYLPASAFLAAMSTALVLFFGGLFESQGLADITVGLVVTFNAYVLLLAQPLRFVGFVILLTTQAVASSERVFEILDEEELIVSKPSARRIAIKGQVRFENVSTRYRSSSHAVLKGINLEAKPGEVVAIIGPTGGGKTSIANLIPRFYDVADGRVLIDGVDVRDIELHNLRSQIGVVMQQSLLFSATIIVQHGTHESLLAEGSLYEEIYKLQLQEQERVRREAIIAGIIKVPLEEKRSTQQFRALIDRLAGR